MRKAAAYLLIGAMAVSGCKKQEPRTYRPAPTSQNYSAPKSIETKVDSTASPESTNQIHLTGVYNAHYVPSIEQSVGILNINDGRIFNNDEKASVIGRWEQYHDINSGGWSIDDEFTLSAGGRAEYIRNFCEKKDPINQENNMITIGNAKIIRSETYRGRWTQNGNIVDISVSK